MDEVRLEIGIGGGEHLVAQAHANPTVGFIGIEPFVAAFAKGVQAVGERGLRNVRLYDDDAVPLLDWLPAHTLSEIDLLYPDPWPKRRHAKRRFVNARNLDRICRLLEPGGRFRFASDAAAYVDWALAAVHAHGGLRWTAETADDWRRPWAGWPGTRYEAKALRAGRIPAYLTFRIPQ